MALKQKIINLLRWSQKYTETDMVYLAKNSFWWIFGNSWALLLSLLTMVAFSHWVSKEVFGSYQYVLSVVSVIAIFTIPGIDTALIRAIAKRREGMLLLCAKEKFKWSLVGTFVSLSISFWYFVHHNSILGISFFIASLFFFFPRIGNLFDAFWTGKKRFDIGNKYLTIINLLEAVILIPVIIFTKNLILIILAYFVSRSLFRMFFLWLTIKQTKNKQTDKETLSFGKHLTLMQSIGLFANQLDKIILWQFLGPSMLAIYAFAQLPLDKAKAAIPISQLALPKLSEKNIKEIKRSILKKFYKLFFFSALLTAAFILTAPFIYKILFPKYQASVPYFQGLSLTLIFLPFSILGTSLIANMRQKELYFNAIIIPIFKISLFLILIPLYGIWGIVAALLISQTLGSSLTFYFFKKI